MIHKLLTGKSIGLFLAVGILVNLLSVSVTGQGNPNAENTEGKADKNLKSVARVNPVTRAMEMNVPLASYPGRGGNSTPMNLSYSSKAWRMESFGTWQRHIPATNQMVTMTDLTPRFGEQSSAGWTSSLVAPRIEFKEEYYDFNGFLISQDLGGFYENSSNTIPEGCAGQNPTAHACILLSSTTHCVGIIIDGVETTECETTETYGCFNFNGGFVGFCIQPGDHTPIVDNRYVKRIRVYMANGSAQEFRKDDYLHPVSGNFDFVGTFLAVDGSGARLELGAAGQDSTLYYPNGSRYVFKADEPMVGISKYASEFIDTNGNRTKFERNINNTNGVITGKVIDTLGRTIDDPFYQNKYVVNLTEGIQEVPVQGIDGVMRVNRLKWERLEQAFDNQNRQLKYRGSYHCRVNNSPYPNSEVLFPTPNENLDAFRICNSLTEADAGQRFNPIVLKEIEFPNGKKYEYRYNEYGEITEIKHPTGAKEVFEYEQFPPLGIVAPLAYTQTNRGVKKHWIYENEQATPILWQYNQGQVIAPDGSRVESDYHISIDSLYGFDDPLAGMVKEVRKFDTNGQLRARTLNDWTVTSGVNGNNTTNYAKRDPKLLRTISMMFEGGKILATMSENEYEVPGANGVPSDASYFAQMNVKQTKSYHYLPLTTEEANQNYDMAIVNLRNKFHNTGQVATIGQTDYLYGEQGELYKARGIIGLPVETRAVDPTNTSNILGKSRIIYDNQTPSSSPGGYTSTETYGITGVEYDCSNGQPQKICWQNPNSAFLGRPTTSRVWNKDTDTWIESHVRYDIFGNAVKVKDAIGNEASAIFTATYKYAYPETVITPAPDPDNVHGTNQTSQASTTYDFMTGLPLTLTDDFGQTIRSEYNDSLLRPTRVLGVNVTVPITETIYDDNALTVKVRSQIDETNWAEQTSFANSLGQVFKTQTKDLQGDVFVEARYDLLGRIEKTSNPYRQGETILWSKPRYDELGRVVESFAPVADGQPQGASLGTVEFGISSVAGFVGNYVVAKDASGRKARTISNKFGIIRVDEATAFGGATETDLGTLGNPNQPTTYQYDQLGNLIQVNQGGQVRTFTYDSFSRIKSATNPESGTVNYTYDIIGNLKTKRDARGIKTIYDYDKANRITHRCYRVIGTGALGATNCANAGSETVETNTPDVEYFYDGKGLANPQTPNFAKGKLTKVSSSVSDTLYTNFDNFGRLLLHQQITDGQTYPTSYKYSLSGDLTEETYPSGKIVRNFFDADGGLSRVVKNGKTYASDFSYTSAGAIEKMRLGNGLWESTAYNERFQPTQLGLGNAQNNTTNLWKVNYEYGELQANGTTVDVAKNNGNIAKQIITVPAIGAAQGFTATQTYTYDALNRLKQAKETIPNQTGWQQTFSYDRFGNRNFDEVNTTTLPKLCLENNLPVVCANDRKSLNPTVNQTNNRFTLEQDYEYDANGNVIRDAEGRRFTYDALNKQTQVRDSYNQPLGNYVYDGDGQRIKKLGNSENTLFVYDAFGSLVAEYALDTPPSNPTPQTSYLTTDTLGSPRIITGKNGEILSRRDFLPFGEEISRANYGNDNVRGKFTGYEKDIESSLEFAQNRYYANKLGRFTTPDPLMASGNVQDAQSWNRYAYSRNNPINLSDPLGLIYGEGIEDGKSIVKWFADQAAMEAAGFTALTTFIYALNGGFQVFNPTGAEGYAFVSTAAQATEAFLKFGGTAAAAEGFLTAAGVTGAGAIVATAATTLALIPALAVSGDIESQILSDAAGLERQPSGLDDGKRMFWEWMREMGVVPDNTVKSVANSESSSTTTNSLTESTPADPNQQDPNKPSGVKLTKSGQKKIGNLSGSKDKTAREVLKERGGNASATRQAGSDSDWDSPLGEIANRAGAGDKTAESIIKLVKQASKKAQKY